MNVEREVVIDLLPVYFSGEASSQTRALVEEHFRQDPEFERIARGANGSIDSLKLPLTPPSPEKEKASLERTRTLIGRRKSFLWLAIAYSLVLAMFRVRDHHVVWIMWEEQPTQGIVFGFTAVACWIGFFVSSHKAKRVGV
ncbi:MAG TPA: hypothetical protein VKZ53_07225 [Candidatus Angelobacter sp.]|nr:hypothetical protein [Candidatus Angelobacter sp.]